MEDLQYENPFAGNRELAEAGIAFVDYLNERFPSAQALVDAIEDVLTDLCARLTDLSGAFQTDSSRSAGRSSPPTSASVARPSRVR